MLRKDKSLWKGHLNINKIYFVLPLLLLNLTTTGCATDISGNSYSDTHVGEASRSFRGVVVNIRAVKVSPDQLEKSQTGTMLGTVGGAAVGSQFGSGTGKLLMTAGGAVAGAIGGAYAEKALKTQTGLEITVEVKGGELYTVVQGNDVAFKKGEKVLLVKYEKGRSKVVKL